MEFKLEPQLWKELSTWGLQEPEEGNPRKKAVKLFEAKYGNPSSSCAGSTPGKQKPQSDSPSTVGEAELGAANSKIGTASSQQSQEPTGTAAACAGVTRIDRRHASELSYSDFVRDFMAPNVPVVIEGTTEGWLACREWVCPDGSPDLDFLEQRFGSSKVRATDTAREYEGCGPTHDMTLGDFIQWWRRRKQRAAGTAGAAAVAAAGAGAETAAAAAPATAAAAGATAPAVGEGAAAGAGAVAAAGAAVGSSERGPWEGGQLLYVKDWHLQKEFPDYKAYACPLYFRDDWLNEWYDARRERREAQQAKHAAQQAQQVGQEPQAGGNSAQAGPGRHYGTGAAAAVAGVPCSVAGELAGYDEDEGRCAEGREGSCCDKQHETQGGDDVTSDYRFVYLGPKGTWTPLHSDVLRSYSWSTNVAGRKRWRLLHPRYSHLLYDRHGHNMPPDFWLHGGGSGSKHAREDEANVFPGLAQARQHMVEFIQEAGESVFVPSGWHHSVENMEDTLSINHNWVNGHNVHWVWHLVTREYSEAEEGIADCKELASPAEFEALVQRNMGANCGLDFAALGEFLRCMAGRSMEHFRSCGEHNSQGSSTGCGGSRSSAGAAAAAPTEAAPACDCCARCAVLPACCAHHALRLRRAGLVLKQLLAAEERIAQQGGPQHPVEEQPGGHAQGQQQAGQQQRQGSSCGERPPHEAEIAANRVCLDEILDILCPLGLGQIES
ncbi:hypothetical protein N2152v2_010043 [Parachlorella kessleri]